MTAAGEGGKTRLRASQKVADHLRRNILAGKYRIGERVPSEHALARGLGVSRVSVRLAVQQFMAIGVLESVHGSGTFLRSLDFRTLNGKLSGAGWSGVKGVRHILQFRLCLEPEACSLAAEAGDSGMLERLGRHLGGQAANVGNSEEFVRRDIAFHLEIARACGNPLVYGALREVFGRTQLFHRRINRIFGYKDGVYYHSLIHRALERRDPKLARKAMRDHLEQALEQLIRR